MSAYEDDTLRVCGRLSLCVPSTMWTLFPPVVLPGQLPSALPALVSNGG